MLLAQAPQTLRLAAPNPGTRGKAGAATTPGPSHVPHGKAAYVLREAMILALFAATLAATYYLGRTHAFQNVIIVPEPWSRHSMLG